MNEPLPQPANCAAAEFHLRMIVRPDVASDVAPKQPQAAIVPPRTVADRMAHEVIKAVDPVAVVPWLDKLIANFVRQLGRDPLIRVENENPVVCGLRNRPILEVATRTILALDDSASEPPRDLKRAVGRTRIGREH